MIITYSKATVYAQDAADNVDEAPLAVSYEVTMKTDDDGYEHIILKNFSTENLVEGRTVQLLCFTEKGVQSITASTSFITQNVQANFRVIERGEVNERRNNVKVPVALSGQIIGHYEDALYKPLRIPLRVSIRNLSVGGMMFFTNDPLTVNDKYKLNFEVERLSIDVDFTIIRQDVTDLENTYVYGARFGTMSDEVDAHLCNYIYRIQIEEHRKRKEAKYRY